MECHRPALVRYLRSQVTDENDVQDLVQETLLRAARYRKAGQPLDSLRGWLLRIARNLRLDAGQRSGRYPAQGLDLDGFASSDEGQPGAEEPESSFAWGGRWWAFDEIVQHLRSGWARLSEIDRRTLHGYYSEARGRTELADRLGIQPELVKVRLFRARQRLARWMELRMRAVCPGDWSLA